MQQEQEQEEEQEEEQEQATSSGLRARALYDYEAGGQKERETGRFVCACAYVCVCVHVCVSSCKCIAAHHPCAPSFLASAAGDDEISFDPEDIIEDVDQVDEGWWMGTCHNRRGLFPANFVEIIEQ